MTREQAQIILMKAFVATGELPVEFQLLLAALIREAESVTSA